MWRLVCQRISGSIRVLSLVSQVQLENNEAAGARAGARFDSLPRSLSRLASNGSAGASMSCSHASLPVAGDHLGLSVGVGAMGASGCASESASLQYECLACLGSASGPCPLHAAEALAQTQRGVTSNSTASPSASADELRTPSDERPPSLLPSASLQSDASASACGPCPLYAAPRVSCVSCVSGGSALAASAQLSGLSGASLNSHADSQDSGLCSQSQAAAALNGLKLRNASGGALHSSSDSVSYRYLLLSSLLLSSPFFFLLFVLLPVLLVSSVLLLSCSFLCLVAKMPWELAYLHFCAECSCVACPRRRNKTSPSLPECLSSRQSVPRVLRRNLGHFM